MNIRTLVNRMGCFIGLHPDVWDGEKWVCPECGNIFWTWAE